MKKGLRLLGLSKDERIPIVKGLLFLSIHLDPSQKAIVFKSSTKRHNEGFSEKRNFLGGDKVWSFE